MDAIKGGGIRAAILMFWECATGERVGIDCMVLGCDIESGQKDA